MVLNIYTSQPGDCCYSGYVTDDGFPPLFLSLIFNLNHIVCRNYAGMKILFHGRRLIVRSIIFKVHHLLSRTLFTAKLQVTSESQLFFVLLTSE